MAKSKKVFIKGPKDKVDKKKIDELKEKFQKELIINDSHEKRVELLLQAILDELQGQSKVK